MRLDLEQGMTVEFDPSVTNEQYNESIEYWERCRAARKGAVAIKNGGTQFLPKLSGHISESCKEYVEYKERAIWYGATGATVDAFKGMIFRKTPTFDFGFDDLSDEEKERRFGDIKQKFLKNVSPEGHNIGDVLRSIVDEVITVSRVGVLENFPNMIDSEGNMKMFTQLEFEKNGITSKTSIYKAEQIINWRTEVIQGSMIPVMFVLKEYEETQSEDNPFEVEIYPIYRVLYIEDMENGSIEYRQAVFEKVKGSESYFVRELYTPLLAGKPLNYIPFWVLTDSGTDVDLIHEPMIIDLVELNIGHYRNSADYEHELHLVSIKTACFPGWDVETMGEPVLGQAIATPPDQNPFILEASGSSGIKDEMQSKEQRMATLGAQMIAQRNRYVEAKGTAEIHSFGEASILANLAESIGATFSEILTLKLLWSGVQANNVSVTLNSDFYEGKISGADLSALMKMVQEGKMSFDTMFYQFEKNDMYPPGWTKEKELQAIIEDQQELFSMTDEKYSELKDEIERLRGEEQEDQEEPEEDVENE